MENFSPAFPNLYSEDIIEFYNTPYTELISVLSNHSRFRIKHETEDEIGFDQFYTIRNGIIMRTVDLKMRRDNTVKIQSMGGYISYFFNINGNHLTLKNQEKYPHSKGTCGIKYYKHNETIESYCKADVRFVTVEILISKSFLFLDFFGEKTNEIPLSLRPIYEENRNFLYHTLAMDTEINQAIQILAAADQTGLIIERFIEAKSIELICLMTRLLRRQERATPYKPLNTKEVELLDRARELLVADLSSPPSAEELVKEIGMSRSALIGRFKQHFGLSPRNLLMQVRMEKAKTLLLQHETNINQISWQLGYEHSCNFVTAFKRYYGLTPKAYRKLEEHS
ncbi:AraC family transcriptional regulator [Dasania sp. GY-MA-18]|uniref:helix-turn-helix transcriptional regulator n=1 Tax=Dasania sp. GY-MA-18 TaxID=2966584 RepID=UPI0021AC6F21|nr:AraC family transcriptional regulator [Dasania sp. GY-MA-18]MCR8924365.1 AraC family transcriptional regulator [Dasania sp. GY-MA-18]